MRMPRRDRCLVFGLLRRDGSLPSASYDKECFSSANGSTDLSYEECDSEYCDELHYTHWTGGVIEVSGEFLPRICVHMSRDDFSPSKAVEYTVGSTFYASSQLAGSPVRWRIICYYVMTS